MKILEGGRSGGGGGGAAKEATGGGGGGGSGGGVGCAILCLRYMCVVVCVWQRDGWTRGYGSLCGFPTRSRLLCCSLSLAYACGFCVCLCVCPCVCLCVCLCVGDCFPVCTCNKHARMHAFTQKCKKISIATPHTRKCVYWIKCMYTGKYMYARIHIFVMRYTCTGISYVYTHLDMCARGGILYEHVCMHVFKCLYARS